MVTFFPPILIEKNIFLTQTSCKCRTDFLEMFFTFGKCRRENKRLGTTGISYLLLQINYYLLFFIATLVLIQNEVGVRDNFHQRPTIICSKQFHTVRSKHNLYHVLPLATENLVLVEIELYVNAFVRILFEYKLKRQIN